MIRPLLRPPLRPRLCRFRLLLAAAFCVVATRGGAHAGTLTEDVTLVHGGLTRYFDVYVPSSLPVAGAPLVIVLHGGTQSNEQVRSGATVEWLTRADADGFLLLIPNGTDSSTGLSGPTGSFNWNDCRNDAGPAATTADDVGFVSALIDWAIAQHAIDPERVYASGASNGGLMSQRLALELSDRIAAVGAVISNLAANSECPAAPAHPISVLLMNGSGETVFMPWAGGQVSGNRGLVLSATATRDFWKSALGVAGSGRAVRFPDLSSTDGGRAVEERWCAGNDGAALAFFTIEGGGHTYPSIAHPIGAAAEALVGKQNHDIEAVTEVWSFLRAQRRTGGSIPACGNLCLDSGEACDDGNTLNGDCCSATCDTAAVCPTCEACDLGSGECATAPRADCAGEARLGGSRFSVTDAADPARDRVSWSLAKGDPISVPELGSPEAGDSFTLCVFDGASEPVLLLRARAPGGAACDDAGCWSRAADGGVRFRSRTGDPEGVKRLAVKPGTEGHSRLKLAAGGERLTGRPGGLAALPWTPPLRAQLQTSGGGCWESDFPATGVTRNDTMRLKAHSQ